MPYKLLVPGHLAPIIPIGVRLGSEWHRLECYVDSGAAYSIFAAKVARDVGFDFAAGQRVWVQMGDGVFLLVFLHRLAVQIGPHRFEARLGFSEELGVRFNLLGRLDVFEQFHICFRERRQMVVFEREKSR